VSLEGASLRPDNEGDEALYGRKVSASEIVLGPAPKTPISAHSLITTLEKASPSLKKS
jgi:lipid-binding SYLF domain-containing protein